MLKSDLIKEKEKDGKEKEKGRIGLEKRGVKRGRKAVHIKHSHPRAGWECVPEPVSAVMDGLAAEQEVTHCEALIA